MFSNGIVVLLTALAGAPAAGQPAGWVWWEGERPAASNFPARTWFSPSAGEAAALSGTTGPSGGGDWLTSEGKRGKDELFARYEVALPAAGRYQLWCRKFWKHGPFRWRFGDQVWQTCGSDVALADSVSLRLHVGANWVHLGQVELAAGKHTFELRLLAAEGESATAAFDCFLLTPGLFLPNGKLKPGEKLGLAEPGYFAYEPGLDRFAADALLDLRGLNETTAGESGFVRRRGDDLVTGDGKPVRFWAVNVSAETAGRDRASVDYLARRLAKLGVNLVRFHSPIFDASPGDPSRVDTRRLDNLHYLIAALKKQGIYTKVSFYFPLWFDIKPGYGIEGFEGQANKKPFALLYFEPRLQAIHRAWARALFTTPNPYTGTPLAGEPALAMVEIINEDSLFFWTFTRKSVPAPHWKALEKRFGAWLAGRYGTLDKALAAWGSARAPGDDAAGGAAGILDVWHMTGDGARAGGPDKRKRLADQVRFLVELQRGFYADAAAYYKKDLGYGGLVTASNWHVADARTLDALERYTYTAGDVIDRHGYFGGKHEGDGASYSVRVGHTFQDRPAVLEPQALPIQFNQAAGFPHIISEIGWPNPNRFRADATLLAAAYGSLQGADGFCWFAVGSNYVQDSALEKFAVTTPVIAGTFPAAALMYRRGDVTTPPPVAYRSLKLESLYRLEGSDGAVAQALDTLRHADVPAAARGKTDPSLDPLACYVGPVVWSLDPLPAGLKPVDLSRLIDPTGKTVTSATGQLRWDYGRGLVTVDTPRTKAAAGFLKRAGPIKLGAVVVESGNEYGSVIVTALDDQPLAASKKVLIQAMTEERPLGFLAEGGVIKALGGAPFGVRRIEVKVTLPVVGPAVRVVALDPNGQAAGPAGTVSASAGQATVTLAPDAIYTIVTP